ncbi:cache domain-containing sensor histidine kinase [Paenibacillus pasadenensis]|uniref:cache domain-containing sensor histidine kinase n=1 Tax=Paenibacillus TaxID=44249 RepID=UPI0003FA93AE|nr:sensor histidine kinase [Paenibacillus pasadenensis]
MTLPAFVMRIVNRLSLKFKLFVLLILISIIPITLVAYNSNTFMFRSGTAYSGSISSQYVDFVSTELNAYLQSLNQSFDPLFSTPAFVHYMGTPDSFLKEQAEDLMRFRPLVRSSLQFHPEVIGVLYLDRLGKAYFDSYQRQLDPAYSFGEDPWYQKAFRINRNSLSEPHSMPYVLYSKDTTFSYIRPILDTDTGVTRAVFVVEIQESRVKGMLRGEQTGRPGQVILMHTRTGATVSETPVDSGVMRDFQTALAGHAGSKQPFLFRSGQTEYQASYAALADSQWLVVWTAPLNTIHKAVRQTVQLSLLIAVLSLLTALIVAFPVMSVILRPLDKLKAGMLNLGHGKYVPIPQGRRYDEIGYLIRSFNQTLEKLQRMEREVYQANLREKERELLQLQAQINPHFLFNTLETIDSYASRNNGEAVGEMVQSVSRMMRHTVRNDDGWAPLREELDYIRNFLTIHYYRNGRDLNARFDIDPAAMEVPVMKLSVQPYIENAIKYGWSPNMTTDEFKLIVKVSLQENRLVIDIQDTGTGMPPDVLRRIRQLIAQQGESKDPYFRSHTGVRNTFRRLFLVYGSEAEVAVESEPGAGTRFRFRIPAGRSDR